MAEGGVLFVRNNEETEEVNNPWDDTLLIRAYDKALSLAKEIVEAEGSAVSPAGDDAEEPAREPTSTGRRKKSHGKSKYPKNWKVGYRCNARYSQDGIYYEAIIRKIADDTCLVEYIGFGNKETVFMSELRPHSSKKKPRDAARLEAMECDPSDGGQSVAESSEISLADGASQEPPLPAEFAAPPLPKARHNDSVPPRGGSHVGHPLRAGTVDGLPLPPPPLLPPGPGCDSREAMHSMLMAWYMSGYHTGYYEAVKQAEQKNPR